MITYYNILAFVISLSNFNIFLFEQLYFIQYSEKSQNYLTEKNYSSHSDSKDHQQPHLVDLMYVFYDIVSGVM